MYRVGTVVSKLGLIVTKAFETKENRIKGPENQESVTLAAEV